MNAIRTCTVIWISSVAISGSLAGVIRVGPAGDYDQIQPAVDAARDGDVILVEPVGTYYPFMIHKGVTVRSAQAGRRFEVRGTGDVQVYGTLPHQKVAIAGMNYPAVPQPYDVSASVYVRDCDGELLLEDVSLRSEEDYTYAYAFIEKCANVTIGGLEIINIGESGGGMDISRSNVRLEGSFIYPGRSCPGQPGISLMSSTLVIASSNIAGGKGSDCQGGCPGGDGIAATNSQVTILGGPLNWVHGGEGGSGCGWLGGDGGAGFRGTSAVVSRVAVEAGAGKDGGRDGPVWDGQLTRVDLMPTLQVPLDLQPGDAFDLMVRTVDAGMGVLLLASETGFVVDPAAIGPPLALLPTGWFRTIPLGPFDANSTRAIALTAPADPLLVGFRMHVQVSILGATERYRTNAISRLFGE